MLLLTSTGYSNTIQVIKDLFLIITSLIATLIAIYTLNQWRKEFKAKTYFDCAYRLLKSTYSLRDTFASMRAPFISPNENEVDPRSNLFDESSNTQFILRNRSAPFKESLNNFYSILPEAEVLFKTEIREIKKEVNDIVSLYIMKRNEYIQLIGNTNNFEHLKEVKSFVYGGNNEDVLNGRLENAIIRIENLLTEHIILK